MKPPHERNRFLYQYASSSPAAKSLSGATTSSTHQPLLFGSQIRDSLLSTSYTPPTSELLPPRQLKFDPPRFAFNSSRSPREHSSLDVTCAEPHKDLKTQLSSPDKVILKKTSENVIGVSRRISLPDCEGDANDRSLFRFGLQGETKYPNDIKVKPVTRVHDQVGKKKIGQSGSTPLSKSSISNIIPEVPTNRSWARSAGDAESARDEVTSNHKRTFASLYGNDAESLASVHQVHQQDHLNLLADVAIAHIEKSKLGGGSSASNQKTVKPASLECYIIPGTNVCEFGHRYSQEESDRLVEFAHKWIIKKRRTDT